MSSDHLNISRINYATAPNSPLGGGKDGNSSGLGAASYFYQNQGSQQSSPRKITMAQRLEKEILHSQIAEKHMARLAKEDIETFKQKQTEMIQRFDPKQLKMQRGLPPIVNTSTGAMTQRNSTSQQPAFSLPPLTSRAGGNGSQWNNLNLIEVNPSPYEIQEVQEQQYPSLSINPNEESPTLKRKRTNIHQELFDLESKLSSIAMNNASIEPYKKGQGSNNKKNNQRQQQNENQWNVQGGQVPQVKKEFVKVGTLNLDKLLKEIKTDPSIPQ